MRSSIVAAAFSILMLADVSYWVVNTGTGTFICEQGDMELSKKGFPYVTTSDGEVRSCKQVVRVGDTI